MRELIIDEYKKIIKYLNNSRGTDHYECPDFNELTDDSLLKMFLMEHMRASQPR